MTAVHPMTTEYVVLRSELAVGDSDMPRSYEGEWRKRDELDDDTFVELLGPAGNVRAYPTDRTELAPDGSTAQVYEVATGAADDEYSEAVEY